MSERPKYSLTQSLLSSWLYIYRDFRSIKEEERAVSDFISVLRREEIKKTEAMENGNKFEELVMSVCAGDRPLEHEWYNAAAEIAQAIRGGQFQVKANKDIEVDGIAFNINGRLDCLKAGTIYDIKFTENENNFMGNYIKSPQHPMYFELVPEARRFAYIVYNNHKERKDVSTETYSRSECIPIQYTISEFIAYLKASKLFELYDKHWRIKERSA